MPGDAALSQELKLLQADVVTAQQNRAAPPPSPAPASAAPDPSAPSTPESAEEHKASDYLRELADEVTRFFEQAEQTVSSHPGESVAGAFVAGVLVGRLLGRR